jgi:hypothetical protein
MIDAVLIDRFFAYNNIILHVRAKLTINIILIYRGSYIITNYIETRVSNYNIYPLSAILRELTIDSGAIYI